MTRQLTQAAQAAKAIRKELKDKFPGVKFYVRSSNFAGGNSVDVAYNTREYGQVDGMAPLHEVAAIANRYQYGHFDPMNDLYEYTNTRDDLPQAKYVHVSHCGARIVR